MDKMKNKMEEKIQKQHIIEEGDVILAAVSGGADSVCMLLLLCELQKKIPFSLQVVHVEHGIRGKESVMDAEFVEKLCKDKGLLLTRFDVKVPEYAKEHGLGEEEAARILRYDCFLKAAQKLKKGDTDVKIALAHHADDNAETILFQMVRGSGIDGLCGMQPIRRFAEHIYLIRPLLTMGREEIETYLKELGQPYCTDSTNADMAYSRNRIRHEILPLLSKVNAQAVAHINQSAKMLCDIAYYMENQAQTVYEKYRTPVQDGIFLSELLWQEQEVLRKEVLHEALADVAQSKKDIASVHVKELDELMKKQVGRTLSFPYQIQAKRQYGGIFLGRKKQEDDLEQGEIFSISTEKLSDAKNPFGLETVLSGKRWRFHVFPFSGKMEEISQKPYTKWFDYDKIQNGLQIRKRRQGDYLTVDEEGHTKKLKQYFINEKIPQEERGRIWLLTDASSVLWVVGRRIGASYKVTEGTKRVLEVQLVEEEK